MDLVTAAAGRWQAASAFLLLSVSLSLSISRLE